MTEFEKYKAQRTRPLTNQQQTQPTENQNSQQLGSYQTWTKDRVREMLSSKTVEKDFVIASGKQAPKKPKARTGAGKKIGQKSKKDKKSQGQVQKKISKGGRVQERNFDQPKNAFQSDIIYSKSLQKQKKNTKNQSNNQLENQNNQEQKYAPVEVKQISFEALAKLKNQPKKMKNQEQKGGVSDEDGNENWYSMINSQESQQEYQFKLKQQDFGNMRHHQNIQQQQYQQQQEEEQYKTIDQQFYEQIEGMTPQDFDNLNEEQQHQLLLLHQQQQQQQQLQQQESLYQQQEQQLQQQQLNIQQQNNFKQTANFAQGVLSSNQEEFREHEQLEDFAYRVENAAMDSQQQVLHYQQQQQLLLQQQQQQHPAQFDTFQTQQYRFIQQYDLQEEEPRFQEPEAISYSQENNRSKIHDSLVHSTGGVYEDRSNSEEDYSYNNFQNGSGQRLTHQRGSAATAKQLPGTRLYHQAMNKRMISSNQGPDSSGKKGSYYDIEMKKKSKKRRATSKSKGGLRQKGSGNQYFNDDGNDPHYKMDTHQRYRSFEEPQSKRKGRASRKKNNALKKNGGKQLIGSSFSKIPKKRSKSTKQLFFGANPFPGVISLKYATSINSSNKKSANKRRKNISKTPSRSYSTSKKP